jgi:hypothetical protein
LNYTERKNAHLANELQVTGPCIMLADVRPDHPNVAQSLQPKAWKLVDRPEAFEAFIHDEVEKALK